MQSKQAFTLIELLVVVLIIGILAAVALPQYQKAVDKARMTNLVTMAKAVKDAQEVYYLANGQYTNDWEQLNIGFQGSISQTKRLNMSNGVQMVLALQTASGPDAVVITDDRLPGVQLYASYPHTNYGSWNTYWRCYALSTNARANKLCQLVTHRKTTTNTGGDYDVYHFPGMPY